MSSDTWSDIQAHKNRQSSLREKLARRKKEREEQIGSLTGAASPSPAPGPGGDATAATKSETSLAASSPVAVTKQATIKVSTASLVGSPQTAVKSDHGPVPSKAISSNVTAQNEQSKLPLPSDVLQQVERHLLVMLSDITLILPVEVATLMSSIKKHLSRDVAFAAISEHLSGDGALSAIEDLLHKFAAQMLITLEYSVEEKNSTLVIESVDHNRLSAVTNEMEGLQDLDVSSKKRKKESDEGESERGTKQLKPDNDDVDLIENLLSRESAKQRESKKMSDEILQLLSKPTAKEQSLIEKFKSQGGAQVKEFCPNGTKEECKRVTVATAPCDKLHFRKIINKHTDDSLGDCSFLNTCFHMDTCKYVHYEIDYPDHRPLANKSDARAILTKSTQESTTLFPPQWIQCDLRKFDMTVLGKFAVVMADPPWDIHMELPYGTMSDDEMRKLQVPVLQDEGYIFLWVTGRAMELGRECLQLWGYERADELIWVKTNQLQRIIRTGRTGHWLNHGKEHCLIGVKGNPKSMNRGLDCDVIVAEVRATSHKPDEIYGIIERLSPGTRKIELFGRPHNVQPNWFTLGNQVDGVKLNEPDVVKAFKARYPDGNCI